MAPTLDHAILQPVVKLLLHLLLAACAMLYGTGLAAQRVTNVTAEQQGQELLIHYALEADGPVDVQLFLSTDRGRTWQGDLKGCTGDLGKSVTPGTAKHIRWNVLQDRELVGDGVQFKVVAKGTVRKEWLNPNLTYGSVTDIDGNTYATIKIGTQEWMAENLRTTRYRDGTAIPNVTDNSAWSQLNSGAWCNYQNSATHGATYGKFYNWYAVADKRGICPQGWHVPTDAEWQLIEKTLSMPTGELNTTSDHRGEAQKVGGKLKSTSSLWVGPNEGGTNESGFSGLPGDARIHEDGYFGSDLGYYGFWWSASASDAEYAWTRQLKFHGAGIYRAMCEKRFGVCVRCLRD